MDDFRKGYIMALCGVDMIVTGVDVPCAELMFNLRPTFSKVLAEQRLGRLTRLSPSNPT